MKKVQRTSKEPLFEIDGRQYAKMVDIKMYTKSATTSGQICTSGSYSLKEARELRAALDMAIAKAAKR